jgi:hypothetical protein
MKEGRQFMDLRQTSVMEERIQNCATFKIRTWSSTRKRPYSMPAICEADFGVSAIGLFSLKKLALLARRVVAAYSESD